MTVTLVTYTAPETAAVAANYMVLGVMETHMTKMIPSLQYWEVSSDKRQASQHKDNSQSLWLSTPRADAAVPTKLSSVSIKKKNIPHYRGKKPGQGKFCCVAGLHVYSRAGCMSTPVRKTQDES